MPSLVARAETAQANVGLNDDDQCPSRGVNDEEANDDVIVIDNDDDSTGNINMRTNIKQQQKTTMMSQGRN